MQHASEGVETNKKQKAELKSRLWYWSGWHYRGLRNRLIHEAQIMKAACCCGEIPPPRETMTQTTITTVPSRTVAKPTKPTCAREAPLTEQAI